ncbi:hypothetical protein [Chlamydiifrater phoenicopteri]|uniref:hypothetical protein n=1 Tax=Chlamydiifrater phoenicopteri TaxID=2681469 RepID=UPI001BD05790|nr:hypothetical protein [Chlamydiifrater phoenicopteri]
MSSPLSSTTEGTLSPPPSPPAASTKEKIQHNLEIIEKLGLTYSQEASNSLRELSEQISSISFLGHNYQLIAEAFSVLKISLGSLLKTESPLTPQQYEELVSTCRDLSESSSSSEPPSKKTRLEEVLTTPTESFLQQPAEEIDAITFLLDTALEQKEGTFLSPVQCPLDLNSEESQHLCHICSLTKYLLKSKRQVLTTQLGVLLEHTSKETLRKAINKLSFKEKCSFDKSFFSCLEIAEIMAECNLGKEICIPGVGNPVPQLGVYKAVEAVIQAGPENCVTKSIIETWKNSPPLSISSLEEQEGLLVFRGGFSCLVTPESLYSIFSGLEQRIYIRTREGPRKPISEEQCKLLAKATFYTLYALLQSPRIQTQTTQQTESTAFSWKLVQHVFSLILAINPDKKLAILPTKASAGVMSDLGFSEEEAPPLLLAFRRFILANNLPVQLSTT